MKWRDLRDIAKPFGTNLYKKRSRSRTLWIGGSGSIFLIFMMVMNLTGATETHTGDIFCTYNCTSYVNITLTYWRVCFDNDFEFVNILFNATRLVPPIKA